MPVYMRRRQSSIAGTYNEFSSDDDDFIDDPDQWRDLLPQPYRMVTKLLDGAFDEVWEIIAEREGERVAESQRVLPAPYSPTAVLEDVPRATCLCETPDGLYVFVGQNNGLAALRPGSVMPVDRWHSPDLDIASIVCTRIGHEVYILSTNDDLGVSRLFAFAGERFYIMKAMNDQEGEKKVLATGIDIARIGDFCAVSLENPANNEQWLEVHKLPRDQWFKEADGLVTARRQAAAKRAAAVAAAEEEAEDGAPRSATASPTQEDRSNFKFASPTLVFRCRPAARLSGINVPTLQAAIKPIDVHGEVLGSGVTHLLTTAHLEARQTAFEVRHSEQLKYLPAEGQQKEFRSPTWHFLTNGRFLPHGLEQAKNENGGHVTAGLLVWWTGARQIFLYSLVRSYKDLEHRPEVIIPFGSAITASAVSPCSTVAAVGLESGSVAVIDLRLGLTRRVIAVGNESIWRLRFLSPSASENETASYPPYKDRVDMKVLIVPKDKSYHLLDVGPGIYRSHSVQIATSVKHPGEMTAWVDYASVLSSVVLRSSQEGALILHDVLRGQELCKLDPPDNVRLAEPWQPAVVFADGGKALYFRGQRTVTAPEGGEDLKEEEEIQDEREEFVIVAVNLTGVPELEAVLSRASFDIPSAAAHPVLSERVNALLELRRKSHQDRTEKLQNRWHRLKETFASIQEQRAKFSTDVLSLPIPDMASILASTPPPPSDCL